MIEPLSVTAPYELLGVGPGWRIERFGVKVVDRSTEETEPAQRDAGDHQPDLRYTRWSGWEGALDPWTMEIDDVRLELRPTDTGQVGVFPEHFTLWPWLRDRVAGHDAPSVLNLFGYTGATTLALAASGAAVTHVDASRPAVSWARRNAELSGLQDRPIRWIVDDVATFVGREIRRGRRYDGVVLDPPTYGHGRGGAVWQIERDLVPLVDELALVTAGGPRFALLTAHTPNFTPERLADRLATAFGSPSTAAALSLEDRRGEILDLGAWAAIATAPEPP